MMIDNKKPFLELCQPREGSDAFERYCIAGTLYGSDTLGIETRSRTNYSPCRYDSDATLEVRKIDDKVTIEIAVANYSRNGARRVPAALTRHLSRALPSSASAAQSRYAGARGVQKRLSDWRLTILEISKSAPAPLRMFSVKQASGSNELAVQNPVVGSWLQVGETEGFVCTTGRPFSIPGTANPLHVRRVHGTMSIEKCLADVFDLSCLTWGRPEGAMRLPISIKLCDRSLYEEAEDVNEDEIEYGNDNVAETSR